MASEFRVREDLVGGGLIVRDILPRNEQDEDIILGIAIRILKDIGIRKAADDALQVCATIVPATGICRP
jgi:hypothetical protein